MELCIRIWPPATKMALPIGGAPYAFPGDVNYKGIMPYLLEIYKNDFVETYNSNTYTEFSAISFF
jgi:hypothetical protein